MNRFARIADGIVVEVIELPDIDITKDVTNDEGEVSQAIRKATLADIYHPDLVFVPCGDEVGERWRWTGKKFLEPEPLKAPEPEVAPGPVEKLAAFLSANPDVAALIGGVK